MTKGEARSLTGYAFIVVVVLLKHCSLQSENVHKVDRVRVDRKWTVIEIQVW